MIRDYKGKKPVDSSREQRVKDAAEAVKSGKMSYRNAEKEFNVSKSAIEREIKSGPSKKKTRWPNCFK